MTSRSAANPPSEGPPTPPAGPMYASSSSPPTIGQAVVAPSGQGIVLFPVDGTGQPTGITSLASSSEVQQVRLAGTPAGGSLALSFGGHSTTPIPTTTSPPLTYVLWTFPVVSGHTYSIAVTQSYGNATHAGWYYEVIQGGAVVATSSLTGSEVPFTDAGVGNAYYLWKWTTVLSGVAATGTSMQVRFTAPSTVGLLASGLRVADAAGGSPAYYSVGDPAHAAVAGYPGLGDGKDPNTYGGYDFVAYQGSGVGAVVAITPAASSTAAATLQAALQALPSIGAGGVAVTDLGGQGTGTYDVTFAGPLADRPVAMLSCADPAVAISEFTKGGGGPSLSINGGPPLLLAGWLPPNPAQSLPYAYLALPQSAPAVQTIGAAEAPFSPSGGYTGQLPDPATLSGLATYIAPGPVAASYPMQVLPPGTYQYGITWNPAAFALDGFHGVPSPASQFLVKDGAGNVLATYSVNQAVAPADYQSQGRGWKALGPFTLASQGTLTLVMTGVGLATAASPSSSSPQPVAILDSWQLTRTSADASVTLSPTDSAILAIPAGWMTTQAGPLPAMTVPVAPPSPTNILPPFAATPKTMVAGYNVETQGVFDNLVAFSNLAHLTAFGGDGNTLDANGYPTRVLTSQYNPGTTQFYLIGTNGNVTGLGAGNPFAGTFRTQDGLYSMTWDGDAVLNLTPFGDGTTVVEQANQRHLTGTTGNRRVFLITSNKALVASPLLLLQLTSGRHDPADSTGLAYFTSLSNLAIYPPDPADSTGMTAWANPPTFHPWYAGFLRGMQSIRVMDVMNTNALCAGYSAQYRPASSIGRSSPYLAGHTCPVASISPPTGSPYYPSFAGLFLKVTTATPHGLYEGAQVTFQGPGTVQQASGGSFALAGVGGYCHLIDATNLLVAVRSDDATAMTNAISGGSIGTPEQGTLWAPEDIGRLIAQVPSIGHVHFNVATSIDVTPGPGGGAYDVAARLAASTPAGTRFSVEFGNECWNYDGPPNIWACLNNAKLTGTAYGGLNYHEWYADRCKAVHDQFEAAFAAAGRPNDVIRLYGLMAGNTDGTTAILGRAKTNNARVDECCVAVYESNCGSLNYTQAQVTAMDAYTTGQTMDLMELNVSRGGWPAFLISDQFPAMAAAGYPGAQLVAYEGSIADPVLFDPPGTLFGCGNTPNYARRHCAARRHPRNFGVLLHQAQSYQDAGLARWEYFHIGGSSLYSTWDTYEYANQPRGTGDPTADAVNVNNPQAKNQCLSEVGGAWSYWASLVPSPARKSVLLRNGRLPAKGLRNGLSRTTRSR